MALTGSTVLSTAARTGAALLMAAPLGACALYDWLAEPPPPVAPPAVEAPAAVAPQASVPPQSVPPTGPPKPARKPAPPPLGSAPTAPSGAAVTVPIERVDPERVRGMTPGEALAWLGEPTQRAQETPATRWRYVGARCQLDLYFYLDLQSSVTRVLHYEVRSNAPAEGSRERCLEQLLAEQRGREGSSSRPNRAR